MDCILCFGTDSEPINLASAESAVNCIPDTLHKYFCFYFPVSVSNFSRHFRLLIDTCLRYRHTLGRSVGDVGPKCVNFMRFAIKLKLREMSTKFSPTVAMKHWSKK